MGRHFSGGGERANRGAFARSERERVSGALRSSLLGYDKQEEEKKVEGQYITIERGKIGIVGKSEPMSYHEAMCRYRTFYYEDKKDRGPFGHSLEVKKV